jgi:hypothetical protein
MSAIWGWGFRTLCDLNVLSNLGERRVAANLVALKWIDPFFVLAA